MASLQSVSWRSRQASRSSSAILNIVGSQPVPLLAASVPRTLLTQIVLPKGMGVGLIPYHQHRREHLYGKDAEEFRPERWLSGELDDIGAGYIPVLHGTTDVLRQGLQPHRVLVRDY